MSNTPRKTYTDAYNNAVLSSFSDRELSFVRNLNPLEELGGTRRASQIMTPSAIGLFKVTQPVYDSSGNIITFKVNPTTNTGAKIPGVNSDGTPSKETTDWILSNLNDDAFITLPDGKTQITVGEATAIVRSRHGLATANKSSDGGFSFFWGTGQFTSKQFQNYITSNIVGRKCLSQINKNISDLSDLLQKGVVVETIEEIMDPDTGAVTGTSPIYINKQTGEAYDFTKGLSKILEDEGIEPGTNLANLVAKEVDQLGSGFKTRTQDGGSRVDSKGKVTGGPTSELARHMIPKLDNKGNVEKDKNGNILYVATTYVGISKKFTQGVVLSGLITGSFVTALSSIPVIGPTVTFLNSAEHWIAGHLAVGGEKFPTFANKLIWLKSFYGLLSMFKGQATLYNNPISPVIIHALIHYAAKKIATAGVLGSGVAATGIGSAAEIIWIVGEFTWDFYIQPKIDEAERKKQEQIDRDRLYQEGLRRGCLPSRYVQSGGTRCVRCESIYQWNPLKPKKDKDGNVTLGDLELKPPRPGGSLMSRNIDPVIGTLPIGVERDKDGNVIYDEVPNPTGFIPQTIKRPRYIYPIRIDPLRGGNSPLIDGNRPNPNILDSINSGPPAKSANVKGKRNSGYSAPTRRTLKPGTPPAGVEPRSTSFLEPSIRNNDIILFDIPDSLLENSSLENIGKTGIGLIPSHTANDEAEYLSYINDQYINATNLDYARNIMTVSSHANNTQHSSTNAGPLISVVPLRPDLPSVIDELKSINDKNKKLLSKDASWLALIYSGGITTNDGEGTKGSGAIPPSEPLDGTGGTLDGGPQTLTVPVPFVVDLGKDLLFVLGSWATLTPRFEKPDTRYSSDGIIASRYTG